MGGYGDWIGIITATFEAAGMLQHSTHDIHEIHPGPLEAEVRCSRDISRHVVNLGVMEIEYRRSQRWMSDQE